MAYNYIEVTQEHHVATVALNRVETLNALSYAFATEITDVFHALDADEQVRVVILRSNARIFMAGLDMLDAAGRGVNGTKRLIDIPLQDKHLFE